MDSFFDMMSSFGKMTVEVQECILSYDFHTSSSNVKVRVMSYDST